MPAILEFASCLMLSVGIFKGVQLCQTPSMVSMLVLDSMHMHIYAYAIHIYIHVCPHTLHTDISYAYIYTYNTTNCLARNGSENDSWCLLMVLLSMNCTP